MINIPFITPIRREMIDDDQYYSISKTPEGIQPGDRCYFYYKKMIDRWRDNPRWTTAHEIYKDMIYNRNHINYGEYAGEDEYDEQIAYELAWDVFFQLHIIPYELQKRNENGDI